MRITPLLPALSVVLFSPFIAAAQVMPECPVEIISGDLDMNVTADFIETSPIYPGVFGGDLSCVLRPTDYGVEQFFVETIRSTGAATQAFEYRRGVVKYFIKYDGSLTYVEAARCNFIGNGGLRCQADLGVGSKVKAVFEYDADQSFAYFHFSVEPGFGIPPEDVWQKAFVEGADNPDTTLSIRLDLEEKEQSLELEYRATPEGPAFISEGQAAYDFLKAQLDVITPITVIATVNEINRSARGIEFLSTNYRTTLSANNIGTVLDRMFQILDLWEAGFEGSKAMDFSDYSYTVSP